MADTKISGLTTAAALAGTEALPGVQGGANVKITADQLKTYVNSSLGSYSDERTTPIVCIGSDHPYLQLYGTNGADGMFGVYADNGLQTYNAICWDTEVDSSGYRESSFSDINGNTGNFLTLEQALELQSAGLEFVAHGTRHPSEWDRLNSGIRIDYLGEAASATVLINGDGTKATEIVLVGNGGAENVTLTLSNYSTLSALKTALDGIDGGGKWQMQIAQELTGEENPKWLWPIATPRAVTGGTLPYNNRRFCISGGIKFLYIDSVYKFMTVSLFTSGDFKIYADGVRAASYSPTTQTINSMISSVKSSMTSFGISTSAFFMVKMDNASPSPNRETYMQGDELARYLPRGNVDCSGRIVNVTFGLPLNYIIRRQLERLNELAEANGIVIKNMAQAGTALKPQMMNDLPYGEWRLDSVAFGLGVNPPFAMPASRDIPWHPVTTVLNTVTLPEYKASVDALIDSGPWAVDYLIHKVLPDGSTSYQFPTNDLIYYDMTESDFVAALQYLGQKKLAGLVEVKSPENFRIARRKRQKPKNLVFNPRFKNRMQHGGAALLGITQNFGWAVSGWTSKFPSGSGNFSAVSISDDGVLTLTTNGALGAETVVLRQALWLDTGKLYDISFNVDAGELIAGTIGLNMRADRNRPAGMPISNNTQFVVGNKVFAGNIGESRVTFSREAVPEWSPDRVMSKAGPFNLLSSPSHLKVNYLGIGLTADIDVAGATPTATTAKEIAAAINAAVSADSKYAAYPELHDIARAERGRVIIELVNRNSDPLNAGISVQNGTTNGQALTVFGSSTIQSFGTVSGANNSGIASYAMEIVLASGTNGTVRISAPKCMEVTSA